MGRCLGRQRPEAGTTVAEVKRYGAKIAVSLEALRDTQSGIVLHAFNNLMHALFKELDREGAVMTEPVKFGYSDDRLDQRIYTASVKARTGRSDPAPGECWIPGCSTYRCKGGSDHMAGTEMNHNAFNYITSHSDYARQVQDAWKTPTPTPKRPVKKESGMYQIQVVQTKAGQVGQVRTTAPNGETVVLWESDAYNDSKARAKATAAANLAVKQAQDRAFAALSVLASDVEAAVADA